MEKRPNILSFAAQYVTYNLARKVGAAVMGLGLIGGCSVGVAAGFALAPMKEPKIADAEVTTEVKQAYTGNVEIDLRECYLSMDSFASAESTLTIVPDMPDTPIINIKDVLTSKVKSTYNPVVANPETGKPEIKQVASMYVCPKQGVMQFTVNPNAKRFNPANGAVNTDPFVRVKGTKGSLETILSPVREINATESKDDYGGISKFQAALDAFFTANGKTVDGVRVNELTFTNIVTNVTRTSAREAAYVAIEKSCMSELAKQSEFKKLFEGAIKNKIIADYQQQHKNDKDYTPLTDADVVIDWDADAFELPVPKMSDAQKVEQAKNQLTAMISGVNWKIDVGGSATDTKCIATTGAVNKTDVLQKTTQQTTEVKR